MSKGRCYLVGNSHIDAAWLWRIDETIHVVCKGTFSKVLELMDKYPEFKFSQSSAQYYEWMEKYYPEIFEKIRERVKSGQWEIVGGMWVESDLNIPSGESLVRQFLYGKKYFLEKFGIDVEVAWLVDSFGFCWTLPQIMAKSGIKYFITQKLRWNDMVKFPYNVFWWIAPDGSRVLAHQTVGSYVSLTRGENIKKEMETLEKRHGIKELAVLYGFGDHGGGPTEEMIEKIKELMKREDYPELKFSFIIDYFKRLEELSKEVRYPELYDELYLQFHRGTYTTIAKVKWNNRKGEVALENSEKLASIARLFGAKYPQEELKEAWKKVLLNQFHDIICGSSIPEVYEDSEKDFQEVFSTTSKIIQNSLKTIADRVKIDSKSIIVFNTLSWKRTDLVEIEIPEENTVVEDYAGNEVPSQKTADGKLLFIAKDVPSLGYKTYRLKTVNKVLEYKADLKVLEKEDKVVLENKYLSVIIDKKTGVIKSIFDKRHGIEVIDKRKGANIIQIFEDRPTEGRTILSGGDAIGCDAWEIYIYQQPDEHKGRAVKYIELKDPLEVKVVEKGPVRATVEVKYKYSQEGRPDSFFTIKIMLVTETPRVDFELHADWHAGHRLAKVAFNLALESDFATYEIPYGFIVRRHPTSPYANLWERAKWEAPGQKWLDYTDEEKDYGVSLLNDCKYGFDTSMSLVRMTLLRSPKHPPRYGEKWDVTKGEFMDQGEHTVKYSLYLHEGDWRRARTVNKAYEFNYPLIAIKTEAHKGDLPPENSFIKVSPETVVLTVVKKSEDSDDIILRFYETCGQDTEYTIKLSKEIKATEVYETDLLERPLNKLEVKDNTIEGKIGKCEIKTLLLKTL
ncbi:MAG: hypothetical protein DRJ52_02360 [Thermoprotei archaeon]|nr:MAG: hypothetical protein DRJ52_02360 [Thermoprotei archaeon]RLE99987.1 MAG: hypothetical protein DRJ63_03710 [Thermoprotei archaeon]HDI74969.1 alpha-mannosidase [Thermoprotei archaeon]